MRNFKVTIDLSDCFSRLSEFELREFDAPFLIIFTQASDPDEVCYELIERIVNQILRKDSSIDARILCKEVKKLIRFHRIESL